jgi:hypothetical protein
MSVKYQCRMPDMDGDNDWTDVPNADYPEGAARQYAMDCDEDGLLFDEGVERIVIVRDPQGVERKFKCSMELTPMYSADEIDPKPEPESDIPI